MEVHGYFISSNFAFQSHERISGSFDLLLYVKDYSSIANNRYDAKSISLYYDSTWFISNKKV